MRFFALAACAAVASSVTIDESQQQLAQSQPFTDDEMIEMNHLIDAMNVAPEDNEDVELDADRRRFKFINKKWTWCSPGVDDYMFKYYAWPYKYDYFFPRRIKLI